MLSQYDVNRQVTVDVCLDGIALCLNSQNYVACVDIRCTGSADFTILRPHLYNSFVVVVVEDDILAHIRACSEDKRSGNRIQREGHRAVKVGRALIGQDISIAGRHIGNDLRALCNPVAGNDSTCTKGNIALGLRVVYGNADHLALISAGRNKRCFACAKSL